MALATGKCDQPDLSEDTFYCDVVAGLSAAPKTLPCKYFYDERGSQLFEQICDTDDYYITRTECDIYRRYADQMAKLIGPRALLLEPGAGSVKKVGLLLEKLNHVAGFVPMDISPEILTESSALLAQQFPDMDISPLVVDFLDKSEVKKVLHDLPGLPLVEKRVVFFPGSTIGNFDPEAASRFLHQFAEALQVGDGLLLGVDLLKESHILEAAYNDKQGVTAAFNLNLLERINNELDGEIDIVQFAHKAIFNELESRIEMHLVSLQEQQLSVAGEQFGFAKNETIHTENSYKYTKETMTVLLESAGFDCEQVWTDADSLFAVFYCCVR